MLMMKKTYKAMEGLIRSGKSKAIGVSNFSHKEIERLLANTSVVPAVHQMELHPWLQQKEFTEFLKEQGIHVTQYSPLGNQNAIYGVRDETDKEVNDEVLRTIGQKHGRTGAQMALGEILTLDLIRILCLESNSRSQGGESHGAIRLFRNRKRRPEFTKTCVQLLS